MGVNFVIDQAASTQTAIALTQGLAAEAGRLKEPDSKNEIEAARSVMSDVVDGKAGQAGLRILRGLVQSLAAAGLDLTASKIVKKASHQAKDEYDLMLEGKEETGDKYGPLNELALITKTKAPGQQGGKQNNEQAADRQPQGGLPDATQEYLAAYSQYVVSGTPELKKKLEQLESQLRQQQVSPRDLAALQTNAKNSLRAELLGQIKDAFLNRIFIGRKNSMEYVLADRQIDGLLDMVSLNQRLGGDDLGNFRGGFEAALREMVKHTKGELREYVQEELLGKFIEVALTKKGDEQGLRELLTLGRKVGFEETAFLEQWQKQEHDLGLAPCHLPAQNAAGQGGEPGKRDKSPYEFSSAEEQDLLCGQLRALYMQRAIKGNYLIVLQTSFRMRKLKNGLIKLGVTVADFSNLEQEGRRLAVDRFHQMLDEVLAERATLYELAGPALQLIEVRQKSILANLERLGAPLDQAKVDLLIEKADAKMLDLAKEELAVAQALLNAGANPRVEKKAGKLAKLINRLRQELGPNQAHPHMALSGPAIMPVSSS